MWVVTKAYRTIYHQVRSRSPVLSQSTITSSTAQSGNNIVNKPLVQKDFQEKSFGNPGILGCHTLHFHAPTPHHTLQCGGLLPLPGRRKKPVGAMLMGPQAQVFTTGGGAAAQISGGIHLQLGQ